MVSAESNVPNCPVSMPVSGRPVFIVGCPRSGTTWLYHILLSAGRFAIYRSETKIYSQFGPCHGDFSTRARRAAFLRSWLRSEFFLRSGLDAQSFGLRALECGDSPGALLRLFMESICVYQHAARWAECTPEYSLCMRRIKRDFPEALFIHIVRDGRDVAVSLAKQAFVRPFPWDAPEIAAAAYWRHIVDSVSAHSLAFAGDVLTLRYEDLVSDLPGTLAVLAAFIGQPIDPTKVAAARIGAVANPNSSFTLQGRATGSVGRWQTELQPDRAAALERMIADRLTAHGYPLLSDPQAGRAVLSRELYSARFGAAWFLRTRTSLGRFCDDGIAKLATGAPDDVTLRPGTHIEVIRRIVAN